jgi:hypothetical protein
MRIVKPACTLTEIRINPEYPMPIDDLMMQDTGYGRRPIMLEFRYGSGGGVSLYVDEKKVASAGGHGYDKKGCCLAQWFTRTFQPELQAIFNQPKYQKQLKGSQSGPHEWYCLMRSESGTISLNGASGFSNVDSIMERSIGLCCRSIGQTKDSTIYLLARSIAPKKKKVK